MHRFRTLFACLFLSAGLAPAERVTITLLATTDLHGNIYPVDYFTARPAERGLAKIATLVRAARSENPNTLLIDCGDTIQGTPLELVWQTYAGTGRLPLGLKFAGKPLGGDPMMLAMNEIGFTAMVLGNHEFNFGLKNLDRARADARFPWLSANTIAVPGGGRKPFDAWVVRTVAGVKVGIIGVTTPAIPNFEQPENYAGYRFAGARQAVETALAELKEKHKPDLVIVGAHMGLGRDPVERASRGADSNENSVWDIAARVRGVDAIVYGHSHQQERGKWIGDTLVVQPKNWGISLARLDFELERADSGAWRVAKKQSRLVSVSRDTAADEAVLAAARPYHELAERYLDTPVAQSAVEMDGELARIEDSPLIDAIHEVQLHYGRADVSFTALFNTRARVDKGPVTVREIAALYIYENDLYVLDGDGRMVKEALENAARYFRTCPDAACSTGPLVNRAVIGFNYDMAQGVEYEIDLTRPQGDRIVNLRRKGKPLGPDDKVRIATNNYRALGSGGYTMFRRAPIVWRSGQDVRSLMIEYYTKRKKLPEKADGNWRIVPSAARKTLEKEMAGEFPAPASQ